MAVKQEQKKVSIASLIPHPKNPNMHTPDQVEALGESIRKYGQYYPIIVDEKMQIICGHGKKAALENIGETEASVLIMHGLTEKQKMKLMLEDNKIQSMSYIDGNKLDEIIKSIGDTDIIGFNVDYLEAVLDFNVSDNAGVDFSEPPKAVPQRELHQERAEASQAETDTIDEGMARARTISCPHCGEEITL